jgi:hypothetical protein
MSWWSVVVRSVTVIKVTTTAPRPSRYAANYTRAPTAEQVFAHIVGASKGFNMGGAASRGVKAAPAVARRAPTLAPHEVAAVQQGGHAAGAFATYYFQPRLSLRTPLT